MLREQVAFGTAEALGPVRSFPLRKRRVSTALAPAVSIYLRHDLYYTTAYLLGLVIVSMVSTLEYSLGHRLISDSVYLCIYTTYALHYESQNSLASLLRDSPRVNLTEGANATACFCHVQSCAVEPLQPLRRSA